MTGSRAVLENERRYEASDKGRMTRKARNERVYAAHKAFITAIKLSAGCADCGYADDSSRLHFDHRPGTVKLGNIGQMAGCSRQRVEAEIDKCEIRCVVCHARRHAALGT
jgi:hypothetical protein